MVLGPKGGVWWFLLLAGALLAAAAVGAAQEDVVFAAEAEEEVGRRADDQGNDMCDIKCEHWHDARDRRRCVNECHSREHHHPSREFCEMKCQHHQHDPSRMELCVQQCMSYGLNLLAGGNNGIHENPEAWEAEVGRRADDQGNDVCDIKCQHWHDARDRRRCVNECHSREHHHPSREFCEMKCQHHQHDMEHCVHYCMSTGLNLHADSNNGGVDQHPHGWGTADGAIAEVV